MTRAFSNFADAWLYIIAPLVGAVIAALLYLGLTRRVRDPRMVPHPATARAE